MYPFDGRIYNAFATISKKENDNLATVFFLMRSLACNLPNEASREFLIDYFDNLRMKFLDFENSKLSGKRQ